MTRFGLRAQAALGLSLTLLSAPVAAQPPASRVLSVSGEAQVEAAPDEAVLTGGVVSDAASAKAALAANRQAMNAVFDALHAQGIPDKSIETSNFSVSPQYDNGSDGKGPPRLTGYEVSNQVTVIVDDLTRLGPTIDALVESGANTMGGIRFAIRDPKPLFKEARAAAVKDALDRAQTLASAAGVKLGPVMSINEAGGYAVPMNEVSVTAMRMAVAAPPTPTAPGQQTVTANVSMTFAIQ